jgi:DNA-binding response OmpR family regulator
VYHAFDAQSAKEIFTLNAPHIILLDIMLPDLLGYNIIPFFRTASECRIIMLSALEDSKSKHLAYQHGADDYITKPFDVFILLDKLRVISKRIISQMGIIYIGDTILDTKKNILQCNSRIAYLQPSQCRLLVDLYKSYLFPNNQLVISGESQYMIVSRLRKHIQEIRSTSVFIESRYSKGYTLVILEDVH